MASLNDFNSMAGWGSQAAPPMFSMGEGMGIDPSLANPMVTNSVTSNWQDSFAKSSLFPTAGGDAGGGGLLDSLSNWGKDLFGTTQQPGWGGAALGAAQGLLSGYLGMKQFGLAKEKLAESKRQFDLQYTAQKNLTNSQLEDRQRARVASNGGAYQSVGDYMNQYGVK